MPASSAAAENAGFLHKKASLLWSATKETLFDVILTARRH